MNGKNHTITVFIVAGSTVGRAGLRSVLQADEDSVVIGDAAEISAASIEFSAVQTVDVWLFNIERQDEFDALLEFLGDGEFADDPLPFVVAILAADFQSSGQLMQLLHGGVRGILPNAASTADITATVKAAADGLISFTPEILEGILTFPETAKAPAFVSENNRETLGGEMIESLTPRETEILEMLADGASNKSIAYRLDISEHTVKFHVASIFAKLGVGSRTEAVTLALRRGLILL
jgi:DNA-binding NarL/FixJ family response regulator